MQKLNFSTTINAPKETVWSILWDDVTYPKWTLPFCEGSQAITDWREGSKVLFLSGSGEGMVSQIETKRPNEYMAFKHLGTVKDGVEDVTSEKVKDWAGAMESYTLKESGGVTELTVDLDMNDSHKDYFMKTFPLALEQVKVLSENN